MKILSVLVLFFSSQLSFAETEIDSEEEPTLTFDYIHDYLAPYGKWYETDDYGFVWRPFGMKKNWQPFTLGKWELTEQGWLWISNFDWGWLPFHYGNWVRHKIIGWCWVPGYDWSPAQVTWYWTEKYVGWAPIPPVNPGESFEIAPEDWFFVSIADFLSPYLYNYQVLYSIVSPDVCVPYESCYNYYFYNCCFCYYDNPCKKTWVGPPCLIIEKNVHRKLKKKKIVTLKKRNPRRKNHKKNVVEIYKPTIRKNTAKTKKAFVKKPKFIDKSKINKQKEYKHVLSNHNLPVTPVKSKHQKHSLPENSFKKQPLPSTKKIVPSPVISPPPTVKPKPLVTPPPKPTPPPAPAPPPKSSPNFSSPRTRQINSSEISPPPLQQNNLKPKFK